MNDPAVRLEAWRHTLETISLVLSDAQLKSWFTAPILIVPAPVAGMTVIPVMALIELDTRAGAYNEVDTPIVANAALSVTTIGTLVNTNVAAYQVANSVGAVNAVASIAGQALFVTSSAGGDLTGGNAANTAKITLLFQRIATLL